MKPLIVIAGPTASGKSACAMELSLKIGGEIVSADSMQIYKHMDIGTAKPSKEDMRIVPHHLIDVVDPDYHFSAAIFVKLARSAIEDIYSRGKNPILVGGTGFYINSLIYEDNLSRLDDCNISDNPYIMRNELYNLYEKNGKEYMFNMLKKIDSVYASITHMNNVKRVIRAIEYYNETGEKFSDYNKRKKDNRRPAYDLNVFIIHKEREELYNTINNRVDIMLNAGLEAEVRELINMGYNPTLASMQGLGYKELYSYIIGECDLECAVSSLKQGTRRFAKRQITWFKNQIDGVWINTSDYTSLNEVSEKIITMLKL